MRRLLLSAAVAVVVAATLSSCDEGVSGGSGVAPDDGAASKSTIASLCAAAEAAEGGDTAGAGEAFSDAHGALHTLAAQLGEDGRRAAAARLLEVKQRVEAGLGAPAANPPARLVGDLRTLAAVVGDVSRQPVPGDCG